MVKVGGGWRPDRTQELLLAACVGPRASAGAAFAQWRSAQPLDALDAGAQRLLPLLVPRKDAFDAADPAWPIIRGTYRRAYVHGQLLCRCAGEVMASLAASGIDGMALKGAALLAYYDDNPALRPMNDFDLLVPRARARDAIQMLVAAGWRTQWPQPARLPEVYHGVAFASPDDLALDLDLHWAVLASDEGAHDAALWAAGVPCDVPGCATRAPCAEDLLTIVCAHAAAWQPVPPVRWVADALRILERGGASFDWARVVAAARAWRVTLQLADMAGYLADRWHVAVPAAALDALRATPVGAIDRRAYRMFATMPRTGAYLLRPWRRYRLRSRTLPAWRALRGFVGYLEVTLGRDWRALPREILVRLLRFRRDRRRGVR
jgi:Uncharacterised nucleotidyltransferase